MLKGWEVVAVTRGEFLAEYGGPVVGQSVSDLGPLKKKPPHTIFRTSNVGSVPSITKCRSSCV